MACNMQYSFETDFTRDSFPINHVEYKVRTRNSGQIQNVTTHKFIERKTEAIIYLK